MEALKADITVNEAMEDLARLRRVQETFQAMLENDGRICLAEARVIWSELVALQAEISETLRAANRSYIAKRIADAVERGDGFDWSRHHKALLAEANLQPIRPGLNVVEMPEPERDSAA